MKKAKLFIDPLEDCPEEQAANLIAAKDHLYDFCKDRRKRLTEIRGNIEKNIRCENHVFSVNAIRLLDVILGWTS